MNNRSKYVVGALIVLGLYVFIVGAVIHLIDWGDITFLRNFANFISILIFFALVIHLFFDVDWNSEDIMNKLKISQIPFSRRWVGAVLLVLLIYAGVKSTGKITTLYNKSVVYYKEYEQKTNALAGFYDNLWKTYYAKDTITRMNKETFIKVTQIIFEARKDGQNVAWKWLTENQQVDYREFTKFYTDLSTFIESQRKAYYDLEIQRQMIAKAHNTMLDTFPNNLYNKVLGRKALVYSYGFLSDSTNKVFSTGKEDPR